MKKNINNRIKQKYGSKQGLLYCCLSKILFHLGYFNSLKKIDWTSVERLIFVCKGNICRSAYAEALARSAGVESLSFGLDS